MRRAYMEKTKGLQRCWEFRSLSLVFCKQLLFVNCLMKCSQLKIMIFWKIFLLHISQGESLILETGIYYSSEVHHGFPDWAHKCCLGTLDSASPSSCRRPLRGGREGKPMVLLLPGCPQKEVGHEIQGTCVTPVGPIWQTMPNGQTVVSVHL